MKYEITVGIGLDRHQKPVRDVDRKIVAVESLAIDLFGGFTIHRAVGGWRHPEHHVLVYEDVIVLSVLGNGKSAGYDQAKRLAEFARDTFDQDSVVLTETQCSVEFV